MSRVIGAAIGFMVATTIGVAAGTAVAQEIGSAAEGLKLARTQCSQCHLVDKVAGASTNPDAPTFETIARTPGLTGAALTVALRTSHRTMPNIVIGERDTKNIVAYILSLKAD